MSSKVDKMQLNLEKKGKNLETKRNRSHATTTNKGKEIAKPITPPSESDSEEDSDPEQAQRDKDMQKNLALIAKYFKKIYKPTNNNLRTSSKSKNKNVDTTLRYINNNQSSQFANQMAITIAEARENVGSPIVQQTRIQCLNCKEYDHFAKECRKPKQVKDFTYHKEKMLLCKQAKQGVPLQAEQSDWLADTDDEIDKQELEAHYSFMAKIQEVVSPESNLNVEPLEQIQKQLKKANISLAHELVQCKSILAKTSKTLEESNSVRDSCLVTLPTKQIEFEKYKACNDRTIDYEKLERKLNETLRLLAQKDIDIKEGLKLKAYKILVVREKYDELVKQSLLTKSYYEGLVKEKIKTQNDSLAFVHELKQEMHADLKYVESLKKEIDDLESDRAEFLNTYDTILQECVYNDVMCTYLHLLSNLDAHTELQCLYLHKVKECDCLTQKLSKQTESVCKEVYCNTPKWVAAEKGSESVTS
nr:hypothetical protein [Tanacetum cinerariifolium]GEX80949.1 hypothetical protein [Tanacetum cinerariifolium]